MGIVLKVGLGFYQGLYSLFKLLPTRRKVVFLSRQGNRESIDFQLVEQAFHRTHPEYQTVALCRMIGDGVPAKVGYCLHMVRQAYHLATARVAVLDSYCILASCLHHKDELLIVQMWHSVGVMKKAGYSILDKEEGRSAELARAMHMHEQYDWFFISSNVYKRYMVEAFHQDEDKFAVLPLPRLSLLRNAEYADAKARQIFARYPTLDSDKENLLYCPTFRKGEDEQQLFAKAVHELERSIDLDKYNLIVKLHPLSRAHIEDPKVLTCPDFSTFDMLFVSDKVISDYSCVIYEAAKRGLPLYFYAYDYDHYEKTRGLYIDYHAEMPGPVCSSAAELAQALDKPYDRERLHRFCDKYIEPTQADESDAIVDFILTHLKTPQ